MFFHIQPIFCTFKLISKSFLISCFFFWPGLEEEKAKLDPAYHLKSTNLETRETLAELYRDYKGDELLASTSKEPEAKKTDKLNAVSTQHFFFISDYTKMFFMIVVFIIYKKRKLMVSGIYERFLQTSDEWSEFKCCGCTPEGAKDSEIQW